MRLQDTYPSGFMESYDTDDFNASLGQLMPTCAEYTQYIVNGSWNDNAVKVYDNVAEDTQYIVNSYDNAGFVGFSEYTNAVVDCMGEKIMEESYIVSQDSSFIGSQGIYSQSAL